MDRKIAGNTAALLFTTAILVLSAWLPGKLRVPPVNTQPLTHEERVALFRDFYFKRNSTITVIETELTHDLPDIILPVAKTLENLFSALIIENVQNTIADGVYLYEPSGSDGRGIRLLRIYMQWEGDWRNWLDAYADIDTGEIYYLYVSSGCIRNRDNYRTHLDLPSNPYEAAEFWQKHTDSRYIEIEWDGVAGNLADIVFERVGETSRYQADSRYYIPTPTLYDGLFEFKFMIQEG